MSEEVIAKTDALKIMNRLIKWCMFYSFLSFAAGALFGKFGL